MFGTRQLSLACSFAFGTVFAASTAYATVPTVNSSSATTTTLTISGANLSGGTPVVMLGGTNLAVQSQAATQLTAVLPGSLVAGDYTLYVQIGGKTNSTSSVVTIGAVGPQGPAGPAGPQGSTGPTGATGAQGPQGDTGLQGAQGLAGPTGPSGPQGPKGDTGPQGVQGPVGPTGAQGPKGDTGATGAQGAQGPAGPQGPIGNTGAQGDEGPDGPSGVTGPQGPRGLEGPAGPPGGPALSLLDANGTVVGTVATGVDGNPAVFANVAGERLPLTIAFGNWDSVALAPQGPELDFAPLKSVVLYFTSTDCTGTPYIPGYIVSGEIGTTKPFAFFSSRPQMSIYIASSWTLQTIQVGSALFPSESLGSCQLQSNEEAVYSVDNPPVNPGWVYPFSIR